MKIKYVLSLVTIFFVITLISGTFAQENIAETNLVKISGSIVDFAGVPWPGARIELRSVSVDAFNKPLKVIETVSDKNGKYEFAGLYSSNYELFLKPTGGTLGEVKKMFVKNSVNSYKIDFGIEIGSIGECPRYTIFGSVKGQQYQNLEDVNVSVINAFNSRRVLTVQTDKNGIYQVDLCNPGQYIVFVNAPNYEVEVRTTNVNNGGPNQNINFRMKRGYVIK